MYWDKLRRFYPGGVGVTLPGPLAVKVDAASLAPGEFEAVVADLEAASKEGRTTVLGEIGKAPRPKTGWKGRGRFKEKKKPRVLAPVQEAMEEEEREGEPVRVGQQQVQQVQQQVQEAEPLT
jgi:hypothetical protein